MSEARSRFYTYLGSELAHANLRLSRLEPSIRFEGKKRVIVPPSEEDYSYWKGRANMIEDILRQWPERNDQAA